MLPVAVRLPATTATSSVISETVGVPITAASLVPWIVKLIDLVVPSAEAMVKLSAFVSETPRYCTSLLATVYVYEPSLARLSVPRVPGAGSTAVWKTA